MSKVVFWGKASCAALCIALSLASCATSGGAAPERAAPSQAGAASGKEPIWVEAPDALYPKFDYITGVGVGNDRNHAEQQALGALVAYFGQSAPEARAQGIGAWSQSLRNNRVLRRITTELWHRVQRRRVARRDMEEKSTNYPDCADFHVVPLIICVHL
jgi:hypothetical protein